MRWPHLDFLMSNHRDEDHVVIFWQICLHRNLIKYGSMKNAWAKHVTVLAYIFVIQSLQVEKKKRIEKVFRLTVSHKQFWLQKFVSLKKKQISNIFGNIFILSYFDNLSFIIGPPVKAGYVFYGFRKVKCDVLWWLIGGRADVSLLTCVWIEFSFDENLGLASGFGRSSRNDMCWQVWRLSEKSGHGCRCWCWHDRIVQIFVCFYDIQSFSY